MVGSERVTVSDSGVLTVAEVTLSDAGLYTCNSSNEFGSADADYDILLMVYCESTRKPLASGVEQQHALWG